MKKSVLVCVVTMIACWTLFAWAQQPEQAAAPAGDAPAQKAAPAKEVVPADANKAPEAAPEKAVEAEKKDPFAFAEELLGQIEKAVRKLRTYTCEFHKQEYKDGKMLPKEIAIMKFREKPKRIYMKWIGEHKKNQEVLWGPDWNDGELKAHEGGFFGFVTVNLDINGKLAMKDSRHPISDAGFRELMKKLRKDLNLAKKHKGDGVEFIDHGFKTEMGKKSRCYEAHLPKDQNSKFYCYKAYICGEADTHLPNTVKIWDKEDGKMRLVEYYAYTKIKRNPKLTDKDFDPKNEEYKF